MSVLVIFRRQCTTAMYAGRIACCPLLSHVEYAPRALLRLEKRLDKTRTDGRTDGRPLHYATAICAANLIT